MLEYTIALIVSLILLLVAYAVFAIVWCTIHLFLRVAVLVLTPREERTTNTAVAAASEASKERLAGAVLHALACLLTLVPLPSGSIAAATKAASRALATASKPFRSRRRLEERVKQGKTEGKQAALPPPS